MDSHERPSAPQREEAILAFWKEREVFRHSVERNAPQGEFVFFDGPPTANAPPGIHHVEPQAYKDVIPRYKTMRGYRVRRKAGWDTHGLPVELQIEKALGLKTKREVETHGVAAFNAQCRNSVWEFKADWERLKDRMGSWMDMADPYITYDASYMESVWWFLKQAWEKQLLVRDYKVVPWCPRCETPLSSHEVALGYEEVEDPSVFVQFALTNDSAARLGVQSEHTFFLVWTTTPWTLPGNGALAVHPEGEYAVVRYRDAYLILARPLVERVCGDDAEIVRILRGSDLVGLEYVPLYDVGAAPRGRPSEPCRVLPADFVSFDDGTGIVHIAPTYGEDDFVLGKQYGIPLRFSIDEHGTMGEGLPGARKFAKQADADIIADLQQRGLLFRAELTRHTYPFCWRCKTPLFYFARASWYITMSKLRTELLERNAQVAWHPAYIGEGRMGEWLREAKDWAITRERFWGTPLPMWECTACQHREILGSFAELLARAPKRNRFMLMRHGESEANTANVYNTRAETSDKYPLTVEGRTRVAAAAAQLKTAGITKIIASPFARMRETAEIVSATIGVPVTYDDRLREIDLPDFDGKTDEGYRKHFSSDRAQRRVEKFTKKIGKNETWDELARRMLLTLRDVDQQHENETILICSHGDPLLLLEWAFSGRTRAGIAEMKRPDFDDPHPFPFTGTLVNDRGELDVHRPFIDAITWPCGNCGDTDRQSENDAMRSASPKGRLDKGRASPDRSRADSARFTTASGTMRRFPEVVDVWMDSGCMPFAQTHWPFEGDAERRAGFYILPSGREGIKPSPTQSVPPALYPASYISEAVDQTRGWFYTLLAVATVLGWPAPYEHCIVLGHLLDKDGKKMSKSKDNVVDPNAMIATYGADVVRWYMYSVNQPWDPKLFDEADLLRISRKPFGTLMNVLEFWKLHGGNAKAEWKRHEGAPIEAGAFLDYWLRARFRKLHDAVTTHLDQYEITEAARAIENAIDDLSTWWLRRSRERLKGGDGIAQATFSAALRQLAALLAPFAPFIAEHLWQELRASSALDAVVESVHLARWDDAPASETSDEYAIGQMETVRHLASLGLESRAQAKMPVRQVLAKLEIAQQYANLGDHLRALIADEVNVQEVVDNVSLTDDVRLDTTLTPELQREGMARDLIRKVNGIRKAMDLTPSDRIRVAYTTTDATLTQAIEEHRGEIERGTMSTLSSSSRGQSSPRGKQTALLSERRDGRDDVAASPRARPSSPVGGGAEAEEFHHTLTISGLPLTIDIAREV